MTKLSGLTIFPVSILWSVVLYVVYKYINIDLGLFLSLNSLILFLKSEQDKQVQYQDTRLDKIEDSSVSKNKYNELVIQVIRLKAAIDMLSNPKAEVKTIADENDDEWNQENIQTGFSDKRDN